MNSCRIPAGILPESTEYGHSCRIPGFLPDSAGIPPEFPDSGRNQWGSEKFWDYGLFSHISIYNSWAIMDGPFPPIYNIRRILDHSRTS